MYLNDLIAQLFAITGDQRIEDKTEVEVNINHVFYPLDKVGVLRLEGGGFVLELVATSQEEN